MPQIEPPPHPVPRRELLRTGLAVLGGASALGLAGCASSRSDSEPRAAATSSGGLIAPGARVLFQGDSITDAGRDRDVAEANSQLALGSGYAWLASAGLLAERPTDDLALFNRGLSSGKVYQLAARWDADCLALEPDLLSVLIGVNDYNHARSGSYDGTLEVYERDYDALLTRTRAALPDVRLVVCEPFLLGTGVVATGQPEEFAAYRAAARRVADAHGARWVAFQALFDEAVRHAPAEYWVPDGVHPSQAGCALMSQAWLRAVDG